MQRSYYTLGILFSLFLHAFILIPFFQWQNSQKDNYKIKGLENWINASVIEVSKPIQQQTNKPQQKLEQNIFNKPITETKKIIPKSNTITQINKKKSLTTKATNESKAIKGNKYNKLIQLMFHQIIQHKAPIHGSLHKHIKGKALVKFILNPNGSIAQVKILKSSGNIFIDKAAVTTIKSSAPFVFANKYLKSPQAFALPIEYKAGLS